MRLKRELQPRQLQPVPGLEPELGRGLGPAHGPGPEPGPEPEPGRGLGPGPEPGHGPGV